jgi:hypothetical protein
VTMNRIVNRLKIAELLQQISINNDIIEMQTQYFTCVKQTKACSIVKVLLTVFISQLINLCIEIILRASDYNTDIRIVTLCVAGWVNFLITIQFCKFVSCTKHTLRELIRTISVNTNGNTVSCGVKRGFKTRQHFGQRSALRSALHIVMIKETVPFHLDFIHSTPE